MAQGLTFSYDREADILTISTCAPYVGQESDELADEVVARSNPETGAIESLEVLFFTRRIRDDGSFELPVKADIRPAG